MGFIIWSLVLSLTASKDIGIKTFLKTALALLIFTGFVVVAARFYDSRSLSELLTSLGPGGIALAIGLSLISYASRAWRFQRLLNPWYPQAEFVEIARTTLLHNFFNNVIPMRLGELTFPALLKKRLGIPIIRSVGALALVRVLDLIIMATLFAIVISLLGLDVLPVHITPAQALGVLVLLAIPSIALLWWLLRRMNLLKISGDIARQVPALVAISLLIWTTKVSSYWWIMHAALQSERLQALLAVLATEATSILPVNGIANFGTLEASVWIALRPFGLEAQQVFSAAVNLHLFILALSGLAALLAFLLLTHTAHTDQDPA